MVRPLIGAICLLHAHDDGIEQGDERVVRVAVPRPLPRLLRALLSARPLLSPPRLVRRGIVHSFVASPC